MSVIFQFCIFSTSSPLFLRLIVAHALGIYCRGRLNVLANVCGKPLEQIFSEFDSTLGPSDEGSHYNVQN